MNNVKKYHLQIKWGGNVLQIESESRLPPPPLPPNSFIEWQSPISFLKDVSRIANRLSSAATKVRNAVEFVANSLF